MLIDFWYDNSRKKQKTQNDTKKKKKRFPSAFAVGDQTDSDC